MKITKQSQISASADREDTVTTDPVIDWYENPVEHPLADIYNRALDELDVWDAPSTQGRYGSVVYYSNKNEEGAIYQTDFSDECDFLDNLGRQYVADKHPNDDEYVEAIIEFITENLYNDLLDDEDDYDDEDEDLDDIDEEDEDLATL